MKAIDPHTPMIGVRARPEDYDGGMPRSVDYFAFAPNFQSAAW